MRWRRQSSRDSHEASPTPWQVEEAGQWWPGPCPFSHDRSEIAACTNNTGSSPQEAMRNAFCQRPMPATPFHPGAGLRAGTGRRAEQASAQCHARRGAGRHWRLRGGQRLERARHPAQRDGHGPGPPEIKHFCSSMSDELVDARDVLPRIDQLQAWGEINGQIVARTSGTLPFGTALESGHWLAPGDTLRMAIEGVGEIQHTWTP